MASTLLLGACSGAETKVTARSTKGAAVTKAPETLTVAWSEGVIRNLYPLKVTWPQESAVMHLAGGNLLQFEKGKGTEAFPSLAESYEVSSDQLQWTFKLRDGLKFSDGTPLTSEDVVATLKQAMTDPESYWVTYSAPFTKVSAPDASTVVVDVSRPYTALATILAEPEFAISPANAFSKPDSYWKSPVTAGAYQISWDGGPDSTLTANPYYWGPKPVINTFKFTTVSDANTAIAQLKSGQVDMVQGLPISSQPVVAAAGGIVYDFVEQYGITAVGMNNAAAPLDDVRVRKAISLAVDRDQINTSVFQGLAQPLSSFWPRSMDGYDASISTKQDIAAAKKLLVGTKCEKGCTLDLFSQASSQLNGQIAQFVSADLTKIGITTKLSSLGATDWNNKVISAQDYQLAINAIYDFANIPDGMLDYAFNPKSFYHAFYSQWENDGIQSLIDRATTTSGSEKKAALAEVNQLFMKDMPYATVSGLNDFWASRVSFDIIAPGGTDLLDVATK